MSLSPAYLSPPPQTQLSFTIISMCLPLWASFWDIQSSGHLERSMNGILFFPTWIDNCCGFLGIKRKMRLGKKNNLAPHSYFPQWFQTDKKLTNFIFFSRYVHEYRFNEAEELCFIPYLVFPSYDQKSRLEISCFCSCHCPLHTPVVSLPLLSSYLVTTCLAITHGADPVRHLTYCIASIYYCHIYLVHITVPSS